MKSASKVLPRYKISAKHKLGLLLVSLSTLMLEFTLIRVLSVSLWYHFAFMIISIALLGFGISGVTIVISERINKADLNNFLSFTSIGFSISIILSFVIINKIPFDPFSLLVDSSQFLYLPIYYLTITLPFFLAGLVIGQIFTKLKSEISKLYFFDLLGAGLSCFVFIVILPFFGGSGGIAAASLIAAIAALSFSLEKNKFSFTVSIAGIVLIGVNALFMTDPEGYLPIRISENKIYGNILKDYPELRMLTKWNSFSRVDVIRDEDPPIDNYPVYTAIIDAGNSTTNIPQVKANVDTLPPPLDASNMAMILKKDSANVFIIGSGGGGEILSALSHNARTVTAVEINGILNDLIEEDFAAHWTTGLAKSKKVKIITDDARSFLKGKRIKYDVVISAHTISASASNSGAMSLIENYILTKEAIEDYLRHLKVDGILYITRPEPQIPRLITTIKIVFEEMAGMDSKRSFLVFKRPPSEFEKDMSYLTGIVYKKDGLSEYDVRILKTQAALMNLEVVYDPVSRQDGIFRELIESGNISETVKMSNTRLVPATDDNPYFEHMTDFSDLSISNFKESFAQTDRAMIAMVQKPAAESTLVVILAQALIISSILIFLPIYLKFRKNAALRKTRKWSYILYFSALGLGYIMIEICLIQKFTLFLGQPVYTMLTVISTMLIFSGIGSLFSDKVLKLFKNNVKILFIVIAVLIATVALLNPLLFDVFARAGIALRVAISAFVIAMPSFFMGIPFPYGIRRIQGDENSSPYLVAFSWGVNGFFSVIGSVLVVMLSMSFGFKTVFITAALIYIAASFVTGRFAQVKP